MPRVWIFKLACQLLWVGWYPALLSKPETCATFQVLEEFHMLHLTSSLTMHDFVQALEHITDSLCIQLTPICVFQFILLYLYLCSPLSGLLQSLWLYVSAMGIPQVSEAIRLHTWLGWDWGYKAGRVCHPLLGMPTWWNQLTPEVARGQRMLQISLCSHSHHGYQFLPLPQTSTSQMWWCWVGPWLGILHRA